MENVSLQAKVADSGASAPLATAASAAATGESSHLGTSRQWLVLLAVCFNTGLNAYIYMNTSAAGTAFTETFRLDPDDPAVGQLFSWFLITVVIGMTPGMFWAVKFEGTALFFSVAMNVLAAWLRYASVMAESYTLCLVSTLVCASGVWTILCLPAQISQQRFKPSQWTLTTSLAVQANYAGWLLGALIPAQAMVDPPSVKSACLVQAIVATPLLFLFVACYRPVSAADVQKAAENRRVHSGSVVGEGAEGHEAGGHSLGEGSFCELFKVAVRYPAFVVQVLAFGLVGGVSFAQPSATESIMKAYGFEDSVSSWINVCFIGAGVVAGIVIGKICNDPRHFGIVLKVLFVAATIATALCAILCKIGFVNADSTASLVVIMLLSAVAGAATLGFIGIGIEAAALYPCGAGYACWFVEIIVQGVGGGLGFVVCNSEGFITLGAITAVGALLVLFGYRRFAEEK